MQPCSPTEACSQTAYSNQQKQICPFASFWTLCVGCTSNQRSMKSKSDLSVLREAITVTKSIESLEMVAPELKWSKGRHSSAKVTANQKMSRPNHARTRRHFKSQKLILSRERPTTRNQNFSVCALRCPLRLVALHPVAI